jgi:diguanylate cyclase (GGDEF)-like protein
LDPNRTIILAEDDSASRALLQRQLVNAGYPVVACADGMEALEAVKCAGGGIVIADWIMPNLDGIGLCRRIREMIDCQALGFVYFILLTAQADKEAVIAGFEAGADDYLTKPYDKQELVARLRAGERIYQLQWQLIHRQLEIQQVNAEIVTLNHKLQVLATTDDLTGALNRRAFLERLDEMIAHAEREGRPLGCAMLDLDRFKSINDTHGHQAGDAILRATVDVARDRLRKYDVIGRLGGEEFCVACPGAARHETAVLAERIRAAVEASSVTCNGVSIAATASLGVAILSETESSTQRVLGAADAMLYKAKTSGRNQVWVWTPDGTGTRFDAARAAESACG